MARTPDDPNKAQAWVTKGLDELDFEFYFPQGPKGDPGGFTTGTLLGNTNLNEIVAPGLYRNWTASNATLLNNYPSGTVGMNGVLEVMASANTSDIVQRLTPTNGPSNSNRVFYTRRFAGTWSSWVVYASQRVDQTAGRAIYTWDDLNSREQLIYGDTGIRNITSTSLVNGWVANNITIRRIGQIVYLSFMGLSGAGSTSTDALLLPAGFWPDGYVHPVVDSTSGAYAANGFYVRSDGRVIVPQTAPMIGSSGVYTSVSFATNSAWPTSLPGATGSAPPNL